VEIQPFEIKFSLSEALFCRAHRAHLRRSLFRAKNLFLITIALMIGAVQTQLFGGADWALQVFTGLWIAVIGLVLYVYLWMPGRIYRRNPSYSCEQTIKVDETGIQSGSRILSWEELARGIEVYKDFLLVRPEHHIPWVIPRSAFQSDEQLRVFLTSNWPLEVRM
jgi:hypothetical protein